MRIARTLFSLTLGLALLAASACAQGDSVLGLGRASEKILIIVSENGDHKFHVEVADNDAERRIGLMYRTKLAEDAGMLFDFGEPQLVSMWMKNTLIPLDMAFIDEHGAIIRIAANTTPRSLQGVPSGSQALAVLEVNGGALERLGVKVGDRVKHPMFNRS